MNLLFTFCGFGTHVKIVEAPAYGDLRYKLEKSGTLIGPLDTQIAAHALALEVTLAEGKLEGEKEGQALVIALFPRPK